MKKTIALIIVFMSFLCTVPAFADKDMQRFQPYTDVDISVLENEGFTCKYDEMSFTAELSPKTSEITWGEKGDFKDQYRVTLDIKVIYAAGKAVFIPRLIFRREGWHTYFDDLMDEVSIKNGENRYRIDVSGVSRSTSSSSYSATEQVVEPMGIVGLNMLKDIATNNKGIVIRIGSSGDHYWLKTTESAAFIDFYNACEKAGVLSQEYLVAYTDHCHIITLFNEGSEGTEDNTTMKEIMSPDEE